MLLVEPLSSLSGFLVYSEVLHHLHHAFLSLLHGVQLRFKPLESSFLVVLILLAKSLVIIIGPASGLLDLWWSSELSLKSCLGSLLV